MCVCLCVQELGFCTNGRNWGAVAVNGRSLMFMVDGKMTFEVPLPDVAQVRRHTRTHIHTLTLPSLPRPRSLLCYVAIPCLLSECARKGASNRCDCGRWPTSVKCVCMCVCVCVCVSQAQQVKDDVMLEFHADDDGNDERVDQLMEVAFHVPGVQRDARADGEATEPPAKVR